MTARKRQNSNDKKCKILTVNILIIFIHILFNISKNTLNNFITLFKVYSNKLNKKIR